MKSRCAFLALLLAAVPAVISAARAAPPDIGVRAIDVPAPERGAKPLNVTVWYPAATGGETVLVGDDRLFQGTPARREAPFAAGRFPLVLVSHGSGGSIETLGWLAAPLVEAGFVVAGPNHPGTTRGNSTPLATTRMWERAADLSAVLTALTEDPAWAAHLDGSRVGALGFSLGGHTVLSIVGARAEREAYARYCEDHPTMPDCVWFASDGVDLRAVAPRFEQSSRDPRIKAVVAIDPSVARAFVTESLREIAVPVEIINLGDVAAIPVSVAAAPIVAAIPTGRYATVADAVHLSFLAECQPGAKAFLAEVGEKDRLCDDGVSRTRADIHAEIAAKVVASFERVLGDGR
jgi:predicted dienelactone hydrolase